MISRFFSRASLSHTLRARRGSPSSQGIKFTDNVVADPDLASACTDATLLVFVLPHQFLGRICPQMTTMAKGCRCISLIKGIEFGESGPILISNMIKDAMGGMDVSVLMGANVANEVRCPTRIIAAHLRAQMSRMPVISLPPGFPLRGPPCMSAL